MSQSSSSLLHAGIYRRVWGTWVIVLGSLCVLLSLFTFGLRTVTIVAAGTAVLSCCAVVLSTEDPWNSRQVRAGSTRAAAVGAYGVIAAMGAVARFGPAGLLLLLVMIASSPAVLHRSSTLLFLTTGRSRPIQHRASAGPSPGPPQQWITPSTPALTPTDAPPAAMSDRELLFAWRLSCLHGGHIDTVADKLQLAQERAALLDEMQCRNPAGFAEWMGGGAFGDPPNS